MRLLGDGRGGRSRTADINGQRTGGIDLGLGV
jgi:hypothetical protein